MNIVLDFERPIVDLELKIAELKRLSYADDLDITGEIIRLESKVARLLNTTYDKLTPIQRVLVARHQDRPQFLDYMAGLVTEFTPLAGDRVFGDDPAIQGGLGRFLGTPAMIIGHQKGKTTEERIKQRFGMANPEGYRKTARLMRLADDYALPIITFVNTPGAYPGIDAEDRGQAEAIARCIETCLDVKVPIVAVVIGEGGSGGAIAMAVGNQVLMLQHAIYSVISPEGCASILWRSAEKAPEAANALRLTSDDLLAMKIIDKIIPEPAGGAHRHVAHMVVAVGEAVTQALGTLLGLDGGMLLAQRRQRYIDMGSLQSLEHYRPA